MEHKIKTRREVERKIVRQFVTDAVKAGYRVSVSLERGYDVDEMLVASRDVEKIMAEAFAGDDAHIFFHAPTGDAIVNGTLDSIGWAYIVLGNDGYDVISDYSANETTEAILARANRLADSYA